MESETESKKDSSTRNTSIGDQRIVKMKFVFIPSKEGYVGTRNTSAVDYFTLTFPKKNPTESGTESE